MVEGLARFDDDAVVWRLRRRRVRREPLGFGLGEVVLLVTPLVWLVLDQAAQRIAGAAVGGSARWLRALVRRLLRRPPAPVVVPPLTREQLADVRGLIVEAAVQLGIAQKRAAAIADAVVTRLVLAPPSDDVGPDGVDGG